MKKKEAILGFHLLQKHSRSFLHSIVLLLRQMSFPLPARPLFLIQYAVR